MVYLCYEYVTIAIAFTVCKLYVDEEQRYLALSSLGGFYYVPTRGWIITYRDRVVQFS